MPRIAIHAPPPGTTPDDDRDAACGEMIDPAMDELLAAAVAEGWHPAEVLAAVLDWTVMTARDHASHEAVHELLTQAQRLLESRKD